MIPQGTQDAARTNSGTKSEDNDLWVWITIWFIISMVVMVVVYVRHKRAEETGSNVSMEIALNQPAHGHGGENFVSDDYRQYKTPTADRYQFTVPHVTGAGLAVQMKTPTEDDGKPIDFPVEPDVMDRAVTDGADGNPTTTGL